MKKSISTTGEHKYMQIAEGLEKMIAEDVLRIGDKLPSVRVLSEEYGISMGTAFQAYYHLEGMGLIESRPKSGYYVRFNHRRFPMMPDQEKPDNHSHDVSIKEMISSIYADIAAPGVINFALAVPDASLVPAAKLNKSVVFALRNAKDHCIGYADTQGNEDLRQQIAKLAFNWGGKIKPSEIIITNGCLEAITLCLKAVTRHGDTVAVESPTYFGVYQAIENIGLKVVEIPSDPTNGIDLGYLQKAIERFKIKACVAVPNFNNPLGSCMPEINKKKLVDIITKANVPLIEDDIYGELYFGKKRPGTCKFYDRKGMVMHCSSVSKSLAPGYRIGWMIPGKFIEEVKEQKRIQNISSPSLTQAAIAHFLKKWPL
jgi:DNA-binding transcriptional MocR family regulator